MSSAADFCGHAHIAHIAHKLPRPHAPARMLVGNVGYLFLIAHIAHKVMTACHDCVLRVMTA